MPSPNTPETTPNTPETTQNTPETPVNDIIIPSFTVKPINKFGYTPSVFPAVPHCPFTNADLEAPNTGSPSSTLYQKIGLAWRLMADGDAKLDVLMRLLCCGVDLEGVVKPSLVVDEAEIRVLTGEMIEAEGDYQHGYNLFQEVRGSFAAATSFTARNELSLKIALKLTGDDCIISTLPCNLLEKKKMELICKAHKPKREFIFNDPPTPKLLCWCHPGNSVTIDRFFDCYPN